jgi:hypothetical protein
LGFYRGGTTVGSIGVDFSDNLCISGKSDHAGIMFSNIEMYPYKNGTYVDATLDIGASSGRWKDLYLSGGVHLGGTGSANKLDDYEEGTWTPVLTGAGYSFGTHTGRYTKIGNLVYITALLNITTVGSNNSFVSWSGAPFTTESITNLHQVGVARNSSITGALYQIQINANSSSGGLNSMDGITGGSNEVFTTGSYAVSLTYRV